MGTALRARGSVSQIQEKIVNFLVIFYGINYLLVSSFNKTKDVLIAQWTKIFTYKKLREIYLYLVPKIDNKIIKPIGLD